MLSLALKENEMEHDNAALERKMQEICELVKQAVPSSAPDATNAVVKVLSPRKPEEVADFIEARFL